jgi:flagellin
LLGKDLEKLSTGLRINKASDDAAGLAVSEGLRTQIRGVEQAKKNAMDGMSALSIAEGAMNELHNIMQRQRELAIQASTATYRDTERNYLNQEFQQLTSEINRIIKVTNFNQIKLLDAATSAGSLTIFVGKGAGSGDGLQVDANAGGFERDMIEVHYNSVDTTPLRTTGIGNTANAQSAITLLDEAIKSVSQARADIGAYVNRLESTVNNLTVSSAMQTNAESQLRDVDFAYQSSIFTKNQILTQSATAMLSQANSVSQNVLALLR